VFPTAQQNIKRRTAGENVWLSRHAEGNGPDLTARKIEYEVLPSETAVGQAQFEEIVQAAQNKQGPMVIVLLGGRGAQALHRLLGQVAQGSDYDELLSRLQVFTQDALAPLRLDNGLSFVRDFERLLGDEFFKKIGSFSCITTDTADLEGALVRYLEKLQSAGGVDIFFLGLGPEPGAASHLAYIKPGSGARPEDVAGIIPISSSILEHHIAKFKAGGSTVSRSDEEECRRATHILTLGPAAILSARRIVQSIVDARTAPGKPQSYRRLLETEISREPETRNEQLDANPGLWLRLHPNVRSLILADVLEA
jgi:6-phosphogluconolactonase/glucosamine-6-phosphate isomerase/deaminase